MLRFSCLPIRVTHIAITAIILAIVVSFVLGCSSENPQDLYKALLSTSYADNELPPGYTSQGNSAAELDATAKAFHAVGTVGTRIGGKNASYGGQPTAGIVYAVFPNASDAKGAFEAMRTNSSGASTPQGFDVPAFIMKQEMLGSTTLAVALADNVVVAGYAVSFSMFGQTGDSTSPESDAVMLVKA